MTLTLCYSDVDVSLSHHEEWVAVAWREGPAHVPLALRLSISRECNWHKDYHCTLGTFSIFAQIDVLKQGSFLQFSDDTFYACPIDPVKLVKDVQQAFEPPLRHPDDAAAYKRIHERLFDEDYNFDLTDWVLHGDEIRFTLCFDFFLPVAAYPGNRRRLDPVNDYRQLGSIFPTFYHAGFSRFLCFNDAPQREGMEYIFFEYGFGDDQRSTSIDKAVNTETHSTQEKASSSNKRPKLSENSVPSQHQSVRVAVPIQLVELLGLSEHLLDLQDENLPLSIVIPYIITLFGGVLHISYPPTLDELVLYMQMIHLHENFGIPCGNLSRTLFRIFERLNDFSFFGNLPSETVISLLERCWKDYRSDWVIKLVGSLLKDQTHLSRALAALPSDIPRSSYSISALAAAALNTTKESFKKLMSTEFYSLPFNTAGKKFPPP